MLQLISASDKSTHQRLVEEFMVRANQDVPLCPTEQVTDETRILRAKLILEECLETINALGVQIKLDNEHVIEKNSNLDFQIVAPVDLVEVADGCCDIKVVTTGTLSAFGIPDVAIQNDVDYNNLAKFGPGHSIREDGKLVKPPHHEPPKIKEILDNAVEAHKNAMKMESVERDCELVDEDFDAITKRWDSVRHEVLGEPDYAEFDFDEEDIPF